MGVWRKAGIGMGLVLAAALAGLAVWEPMGIETPAPPPAIKRDVRIVRDTWGVPHIFGKTDADVAYGLAYAESEDDFPTIAGVLASVRGRSGAILGEDGAKIDFASHLLGIWRTTDRDYMTLGADTRRLLDGYAAGLNHYAEKHPAEVPLRNLFPVSGKDIAAGFVLRSPFFYGLDKTLGAIVADKPIPRDGGLREERGSNAFAIAPGRSSDGVARLVSNSHQPWEGPVSWYEVVVHSEEGWDFAGALFPGAPYPLLGRNKTLGWTNTVNRPDLVDTYKLVLDGDGTHYRYDGKWLPLEAKRVWLRVKFGPFVLPVPRTIYRSLQGPVLINKSGAYALRYAGIDDLRSVEQYYRLNKAKDFAEWRGIMATQGVVGTNFIYGDAAGHIGMFYNARFPKRPAGYDWRGVLPGDTSKALWTSYEPFSADPQVIDPPSGWVANSNNTPFVATGAADNLDRANYSERLGIETIMSNRAHRFAELFAEMGDKKISRADLLRIKFDKGYSAAGWAGKWMALVLQADTKDAPDLAKAQALLKTWDWKQDGVGAADALAATVLGSGARAGYLGEPFDDAKTALAEDVAFLMTHYGRIDPPLIDVLRVVRGTVSVPSLGGPDALRAFYARRDDKTGKLVGFNGDSFIMWTEWDKTGAAKSWSIQPWGAAVVRTASKHYADQAALFAAEKFKPVLFDEAELKGHIEREYRP